jgi:hypothetical protein
MSTREETPAFSAQNTTSCGRLTRASAERPLGRFGLAHWVLCEVSDVDALIDYGRLRQLNLLFDGVNIKTRSVIWPIRVDRSCVGDCFAKHVRYFDL